MADRTPNRRRHQRWRPRSARSPKNRRQSSPVHVARRFVLVSLGVVGLWWAFHSPWLEVRRVEVVGAQRLDVAHLANLASIPLGRNIFRVNLYRARAAVESDPQVASAEVSRNLPDVVRILVKERRPVFIVTRAQTGAYFEADEAGVLFRRVSRPTADLPLVSLSNLGYLRVGDRIRPDVMKPAVACLKLAARDRLLLNEITVDGPHELWLNMKVPGRPLEKRGDGPRRKSFRIRLGRPDDLAVKLSDARKVLTGRPQVFEVARYLDVSCAGRPVYMVYTPAGTASFSHRGPKLEGGGVVDPSKRDDGARVATASLTR